MLVAVAPAPFDILAGVVSNPCSPVNLPSTTIVSPSILSIVAFATLELSVEVNVTVLPIANVPLMPPKRTRVLPSLYNPWLLSNAYTERLAKYVKEFNHSILVPLVANIASTPGVINVAAWNKILASLELALTTLPSK